jgi:hypothetical protein
MDAPCIIQGRTIGPDDVASIQRLMTENPQCSRYKLSRLLCQSWNWRDPQGQIKDMAARSLLLKLHERGWITLPAKRRASPNRMRHKRVAPLDPRLSQAPLPTALATLLPLQVREVSAASDPDHALFDALLHQFHYLSYRSPVGENLQYLARERSGRPVACLLFGAAAWQCAARDRYLGWDAATRAARLYLIANNARLLLPPWARVRCLASHVLGLIGRRIRTDWQRKYGHRIELLETFVEPERFEGTCYQAANWIRVGQTQGRTRQDAPDGQRYQVARKDIYLFPLHPRSTQHLREPSTPSRVPPP